MSKNKPSAAAQETGGAKAPMTIEETAQHAPVKVKDEDGFEDVGDRDGEVVIHGSGADQNPAGHEVRGIFIGMGRNIGLQSEHGPKETYAFVTSEGKKLLPACSVLDNYFKSGEILSTDFGKWDFKVTFQGEATSEKGNKYRNYSIKKKLADTPLIAGKDF